MNYLSSLIIGFFIGVGVFYTGATSVIKMQYKNIAAIGEAYEAKDNLYNSCMSDHKQKKVRRMVGL